MGDAIFYAVVLITSLLACLCDKLRNRLKLRLRPALLLAYTTATLLLPLLAMGIVSVASVMLGPEHAWNEASVESNTIFETILIFLAGAIPFWIGFWCFGLVLDVLFPTRKPI